MAIGDTVQAGLMRVDSSPILLAGQAQAQANQAFGNAVGGVIDKFYQKKKDKQERDEREQAYLKMGLTSEEAKAASRDKDLANQFINKMNADQNYNLELNKFNREEKQREANTLFSQYQMGTKTGAVPPLATITDPAEYAREAQRVSNIENNPFLTNLLAKGISPRVTQAQTLGTARKKLKTEKKEKKLTTTSGFRKEFNALPEVKEFSKVRSAYNKVKVAGEDPSPAGDLSLIFNYMKILDPGSVVKEGEFANAQNAGGIDTKIRNFYNQVVDGTRLSAEQRQDFLNQARNAASAEFVGLNDQMNRYRNIATRNKLPIDDILPDNLSSIQEELNTPITTPPDEDEVDDASERARQSTPSATPPPPSQPSQGSQSAQNIILQKAQRGELLTPKEQQILDLLQKKQAQSINP